LGKREADMSQPIFVKLLVVFLSGTLIAGCSLIASPPTPTASIPTATATFNPTSTLTPTPTITLTPTATPTPTLTPTPTSELPGLVATFGLNPEREYLTQEIDGIVYLVDQYNQAKMLKHVREKWVDTSLEEKYGHLAPRDKFSVLTVVMNRFNDDTGVRDSFYDSQHRNVFFSVWSTGNVNIVREFNSELGMETENVDGEVVFRDQDNILTKLDVRFDVVAPGQKFNMIWCTPAENPDNTGYFSNCLLMNEVELDSTEEELGWYKQPGRQLELYIRYERPDKPPLMFPNNPYYNIRSRAGYYEWIDNKTEYMDLYESLMEGRNIAVPQGMRIMAADMAPYMVYEEFVSYVRSKMNNNDDE
jgi:hypothetical protein